MNSAKFLSPSVLIPIALYLALFPCLFSKISCWPELMFLFLSRTWPGLAYQFSGFVQLLYSSGAYPARLEQLLNISWACGGAPGEFYGQFCQELSTNYFSEDIQYGINHLLHSSRVIWLDISLSGFILTLPLALK